MNETERYVDMGSGWKFDRKSLTNCYFTVEQKKVDDYDPFGEAAAYADDLLEHYNKSKSTGMGSDYVQELIKTWEKLKKDMPPRPAYIEDFWGGTMPMFTPSGLDQKQLDEIHMLLAECQPRLDIPKGIFVLLEEEGVGKQDSFDSETTDFMFAADERQRKWDIRFLDIAKLVSSWSKDPSTKVGAVLVNDDRIVVGMGYNGFPRGVEDKPERYANRELKYKMVCHAEVNAMVNAGHLARGCTLYVYPAFVMPPICHDCCKYAIQAGVKTIVGYQADPESDVAKRWGESIAISREMCREAGINWREIVPVGKPGIYRKRPVEVGAVQWQPGKVIEGVEERCDCGSEGNYGVIKTLEGDMKVSPGDWVITGVHGEKYPCKPDIFLKTYEPA